MNETASINVKSPAVGPIAPIADVHQFLSNMVTDIESEVGALVDKIRPVLGPELPFNAETEPSKDLDLSELARALHYEATRLRELIELVHNVTARVEL